MQGFEGEFQGFGVEVSGQFRVWRSASSLGSRIPRVDILVPKLVGCTFRIKVFRV